MGITNEEAIRILEHARLMSGFPAKIKFAFDAEGIEALEMAIKALMQQLRDCKTCKHSDNGNCAGTEECHECMWESNYEQQPNRCDSCTHSEEQDGSNCYECIKGMTDNFEAQPTDADCISRQAAIEAINSHFGFNIEEEYGSAVQEVINGLPSAQPEIIHCWECIYYDPEHIEKNGVRYEYEDMPKDAFDILGTGLVNSEYGINVGGRCCRDYNVGHSEDKRVFVSKQNYCGRAERRTDG